ncbi:MAG: thiamine-phosphate kinase [Actinomycetes bacterium]
MTPPQMAGPPEGEPGRTVGELGEFELIAAIAARLPQGPAVWVGPGDDAAVVTAPDGRVVATTDLLVEGRHFRREWSSAYDIGRKAAAQNCADVVAMGAVPTVLLVGLGAPADLPADWALGLADGLRDEAALVAASVAGGDIVAASAVTIAVTALGDLEGRDPVLRSGARPGDLVVLAGRTGWAAAGLAVLGRGFRSPKALVEAHRRPEPPYALGPELARRGATAMVDVSDGLVADLRHVAEASGVRVSLDRAAFDVPDVMAEVAGALHAEPYDWLLTGGDDHALAATVPAGTALPDGVRVVGRVEDGEGVTVDGTAWDGGGHDHFRR